MNKIAIGALTAFAALTLAGCGSSESANQDATADTVEMPAEEAMSDASGMPSDTATSMATGMAGDASMAPSSSAAM